MQQWRVFGKIAKIWKKFLGDKELLFLYNGKFHRD